MSKTQTIKNWESVLAENELLRHGVELLKKIKRIDESKQTYIVGGVARDLLMGIPIHDVDIATNIPVDRIADEFRTTDVGKSRDFNIVLIVYKGKPFEIANFRMDGNYADSRHPDSITIAETFQEDSSRRDITINALGIDEYGNIIDYQGGIKDIEKRVIKTVGEPTSRFTEDPLRILRAIRFAAKLGFEIDPLTKKAMIELIPLIKSVSVERMKDELFKAASSGPVLKRYILNLDEIGALEMLFPEITAMKSCEHTPQTHPEGGVFEHTLAALEVSESTAPLTNVAILFHDIGKPPTKDYGPVSGYVRYIGHESVGIKVFAEIASRFRFSNHDKAAICFAIENHMMNHMIRKMKKSKVINLRHNPYWDLLKEVVRCDDASRGVPIFDEKEFNSDMAYVDEIYATFGAEQEFENKMKKLINGRIIIDVLQKNDITFSPRDIGRIKTKIRDIIVDNDFKLSEQQIANDIIKTMIGNIDGNKEDSN